jgi:rhamnosyltransferase subunit B
LWHSDRSSLRACRTTRQTQRIEEPSSGTLWIMMISDAKRIVLATFGSLGDLQPFLAIGVALREYGHHVVIATSEIYREHVAAASLEFYPVRPDRIPGQQDPDFLDRLLRGRQSPSAIFRQMFLPALRDSVTDMLAAADGADALVAHPLACSARLAAEAQRMPWISAVMQPMGYLSAFEPPVVGPAWIAAALRGCGPDATRRLQRGARALTGFWACEWHELRAELGLPKSDDHPLWEGQHSRLLSLGLFPGVLGAPQPDWPTSAHVTGFPFHRPTGRALDHSLLQFLGSGEPPIVFTLGTTAVNDPGRFYEESAAAAARLGVRTVLVAGPGNLDRLNALSSTVMAVPFAPHDLLFPHALAIVHQGGIGTLSEALCARKPMMIMPYGHDQADNAWRAARLGVSRTIPRRNYRREIIAPELERLLEDGTRGVAADLVGSEMAQESGAATAAELIDRALIREWRTYTPRERPLLVCT